MKVELCWSKNLSFPTGAVGWKAGSTKFKELKIPQGRNFIASAAMLQQQSILVLNITYIVMTVTIKIV